MGDSEADGRTARPPGIGPFIAQYGPDTRGGETRGCSLVPRTRGSPPGAASFEGTLSRPGAGSAQAGHAGVRRVIAE